MPSYTLSTCLLSNLSAGKRYIADILFVFLQESNPYKISLDRTNKILSLYDECARSSQIISEWLALMSYQPSNFEIINVDVSNIDSHEQLFLEVCSKTRSQNKLIVNSHEGWSEYEYDRPCIIKFNNVDVNVYDKDEAIAELNNNKKIIINAESSIVAIGDSSINDCEVSNG